MTTMRIAEVAARSGVPATTLRYYEDIGLLAPAGRSGNGYREYADRDLDRLAFISRAKQLDISLEELKDLVEVWDSDDCSGVHRRMRAVVANRVAETEARMSDLAELTRQLRAAAVRLTGTPVSSGACDQDCACVSSPSDAIRTLPIVCTLDSSAAPDRIADWQAVVGKATSRYAVENGVGLAFAHDPQLAGEIGRLAAAEYDCCNFLRFAIAIDVDAMRLEVSAPPNAQQLVTDLLGGAS